MLTQDINESLLERGAALVGYADLGDLPAGARRGLPVGISMAVALDPVIVAGIREGPTREYYNEYERVNHLLDILVHETAELLMDEGFQALPFAPTNVGIDPVSLSTRLPHKTVATLAGLGWIGKCALLVNERFGSAIRLTSVLTDADLPFGEPVNASRCSNCLECVVACPGGAPSGQDWRPGLGRDSFFDAFACRKKARQLAARLGIHESTCGICIAVCPWTEKYINR